MLEWYRWTIVAFAGFIITFLGYFLITFVYNFMRM